MLDYMIFNMVWITIRVLTLLIVLFNTGCMADTVIPANLAFKRANVAYMARLEQCDEKPSYIIPIAHDVEESILLQCEGELLAGGCPAGNIMPAACLIAVIQEPPKKDIDNR